jgi:hypothetical protein
VLSIIALFVALGGVSYGLAGKNSVSSDDIINGQVKTKDIKNDGVKSKDIKANGVKGKDVAPDTLNGEDINENTLSKVPRANEADRATNADHADDSDALGGVGPGGYQTTADLLFASADTSAAGITLLGARSRGAVSAERVAQGFYEIEFNRDVSSCTWLATAGNTGIGTDAWIATTRAPQGGQPNTAVGIVTWEDGGAQTDPSSIFVQLLGP